MFVFFLLSKFVHTVQLFKKRVLDVFSYVLKNKVINVVD